MKVYLLLEIIDLGDHCQGVYYNEIECKEEVEKRIKEDKKKWIKHSPLKYYSDRWHYESHDVI